MGLFDEHCRGLVDRSLKSAYSMNPLAFDSVTMATGGQIDLAHADAAWKCGRYTTSFMWHRGAMPLAQ
eukprot:2140256-Pleurochrysis_carterae.AAC.1